MPRASSKVKAEAEKPAAKGAGWSDYKPKEVEDLVIKYAKQGMHSPQIGLILRDEYGIPFVRLITKKTIGQILKENKIYPKLPEDLLSLMKRVVEINSHLEKNKKDYQSYRGFELAESRIRRLVRYYIKEGVLPKGWKYNLEQAKLLIR
jgi:small subunit ribosomal protein S15